MELTEKEAELQEAIDSLMELSVITEKVYCTLHNMFLDRVYTVVRFTVYAVMVYAVLLYLTNIGPLRPAYWLGVCLQLTITVLIIRKLREVFTLKITTCELRKNVHRFRVAAAAMLADGATLADLKAHINSICEIGQEGRGGIRA